VPELIVPLAVRLTLEAAPAVIAVADGSPERRRSRKLTMSPAAIVTATCRFRSSRLSREFILRHDRRTGEIVDGHIAAAVVVSSIHAARALMFAELLTRTFPKTAALV